ncbi:hypothetical protein [Paraclostridium bifermentans]|uniref:hypothetical protein n=1 Tax=Paraclostridium bifermentans TaxID=1490 RepID=UPI0025AF99D1|nr:hypothetical protein [Paraclostridium bifermentans]
MRMITEVKELQERVLKLEGLKLNEIEGETIINYFEGHDYRIGTDEKKLFIIDVQDESDVVEEDFSEIVCKVIEWNEDMTLNVAEGIGNLHATLDEHEEYENLMRYLTELEKDKKVLDNISLIKQ